MSISSITFRLEAKLLSDFKTQAKKNNRNATLMVREFMLTYVSEGGELWAAGVLSDFKDLDEKDLDDKLGVKASKELVFAFQKKIESNGHAYSEILRCAIRKYLIESC